MGLLNRIKKWFSGGSKKSSSSSSDDSKRKRTVTSVGGGGGGAYTYQSYRNAYEETRKKQQTNNENTFGKIGENINRKTYASASGSSKGVGNVAKTVSSTASDTAKSVSANAPKRTTYQSAANSKAMDRLKERMETSEKNDQKIQRAKNRESLAERSKKESDRYEKYMGDDKRSRREALLEQKIGASDRTAKEAMYEVAFHPNQLAFSRGLARGVTLGASDLLEKQQGGQFKAATDLYKRNQTGAQKALEFGGEMAGNLATFGVTGGITRGIGEKGITSAAKLTKGGRAALAAVDKADDAARVARRIGEASPEIKAIANTIARGDAKKAARIAKFLDGIATDAGINLTTGNLQAAISASQVEGSTEDKVKDYLKNQGINVALGAGVELGGLGVKALRNRGAREAVEDALTDTLARNVAENADEAVTARPQIENADLIREPQAQQVAEATPTAENADLIREPARPQAEQNADLIREPGQPVVEQPQQVVEQPQSVVEQPRAEAVQAENADLIRNPEQPMVEEPKAEPPKAEQKKPVGRAEEIETRIKELDTQAEEINARIKEFDERIAEKKRTDPRLSDDDEVLIGLAGENGERLRELNASIDEIIAKADGKLKNLSGDERITLSELEAERARILMDIRADADAELKQITDARKQVADELRPLNVERSSLYAERRKLRSKEQIAENANAKAEKPKSKKKKSKAKPPVEGEQPKVETAQTAEATVPKAEATQTTEVTAPKEQTAKTAEEKTMSQEEVQKRVDEINTSLKDLDEQKKKLQEQKKQELDPAVRKKLKNKIDNINKKARKLNNEKLGLEMPPEVKEAKQKNAEWNKANAKVKKEARKATPVESRDITRPDEKPMTAHEVVKETEEYMARQTSEDVGETQMSKEMRAFQDEYQKAKAAGDEKKAEAILKEANAVREADKRGENFIHDTFRNEKGERPKKPTIMGINGITEKGLSGTDVPTTLEQRRKWAAARETFDAENRKKGIMESRTGEQLMQAARSEEARQIISNMRKDGGLERIIKHTKQDIERMTNEVLDDDRINGVVSELYDIICLEKGQKLGEFRDNMIKAHILQDFCSRHIVDDKGYAEAYHIASEYIKQFGSEVGLTMNAMSAFSSSTPAAQRLSLERSIERMYRDRGWGNKRGWNTFNDMMNSKDAEGLRKALDKFEQIAKDRDAGQAYIEAKKAVFKEANSLAPRTFLDTLTTFRYLAMLGNPKTHIRNITGNTIFAAVRMGTDAMSGAVQTHYAKRWENFIKQYAKDEKVSAIIEKMRTASPDKIAEYRAILENEHGIRNIPVVMEYKTKSALSPSEFMDLFRKQTQSVYAPPQELVDKDVSALIGDTIKYDSGAKRGTLSEFNNNLLNQEDKVFIQFNYKKQYMEYLKANGYSPDMPDLLKRHLEVEARKAAQNEALEATFRDFNELADGLNKLRNATRNKDAHWGKRAAGFATNAVMPFTNTPMNVAKQSINFSPVRLVTGIKKLRKAGTEDELNRAIVELCGGLSGTGIMSLGYFLGNRGLLTTAAGDDPLAKNDRELGIQDYSIRIGDATYTFDWLTPVGVPLFIGAELGKNGVGGLFSGNVFDSFANMNRVFSRVVDPMLEMTMFQGVNNVLEGASSDSESSAVSNIATAIISNYLSSYNPTVVGQLSRTVAPNAYMAVNTAESEGGKTAAYWASNQLQKEAGLIDLVNNRMLKRGEVGYVGNLIPKTDIYGGVVDQKRTAADYAASAFENFISPSYRQKVTKTESDVQLQETYKKLIEQGIEPDEARNVFETRNYNTKYSVGGSSEKYGVEAVVTDLTPKEVFIQNNAKTRSGEDVVRAVLNRPIYNLSMMREEKDALIAKAPETEREAIEFLQKTEQWKSASATEQLDLLKTAHGRRSNEKAEGVKRTAGKEIYANRGLSEADFRYDADLTATMRGKAQEYVDSGAIDKETLMKIYDTAGHENIDSEGNLTYRFYKDDLLNAVSGLPYDEAEAAFNTLKYGTTKEYAEQGKSSGKGSGRSYRRGSGRRSGGGSKSTKIKSPLKTSGYKASTKKYASAAKSGSSSSSKSKVVKTKSEITDKILPPTPIR